MRTSLSLSLALLALGLMACFDPAPTSQPAQPPTASPRCSAPETLCADQCCSSTETCVDGRCVASPPPPCEPSCARADGTAKECGDDGCGNSCGSCPRTQVCATSTFSCVRVTNDTCDEALPLEFDATGVARDAADLAPFAGFTTLSCNRSQHGRNLVYRIALAQRKKLSASVGLEVPTAHGPTLELRRSCGGDALGCKTSPGGAQQGVAEISFPVLPAGEYFLWIDTNDAQAARGLVTTTVSIADPDQPPPANDTCAAPQEIAFDDAGRATVSGDTRFAANDLSAPREACGTTTPPPANTTPAGVDGPDLVYAVTITDPSSTLFIHASFDDPPDRSTRRAGLVYVLDGCGATAGRTIACGTATGGTQVDTRVDGLAPGRYFLVVDEDGLFGGRFELDLHLGIPPANDTCAGVAALEFDSTGHAVVSGDTTFAHPDSRGALDCDLDARNRDVVFAFTLESTSIVTITAEPAPGSPANRRFAAWVRDSCEGTKAVSLACAAALGGSGTSLRVRDLAPGTYYLWLGGIDPGPFTLTVALTPPVRNDTCRSPEAIAIDSGTGIGTARGDTSTAADDTFGSCQISPRGDHLTSPDLAFQFVLPEDRAVTVAVAALAPGYSPALSVRSDCAQLGSELPGGCVSTPGATSSRLSFGVLKAGTYFVLVDGAVGSISSSRSQGAFTLTVTTSEPPAAPPGDGCVDVTGLRFSPTADPSTSRALGAGNTTNARDDAHGLGYCEHAFAGDLVYRVHLSATVKLTATVTPSDTSGDYQPVVYLRSRCEGEADADQIACAAAPAPGTAATAVANSVGPGDFYLWVDGMSSGQFSVEVLATLPPRQPTNDNCSSPEVLSSTGSSASTLGTTVGAQDDFAAVTRGPDVVYAVDLPAPRRLVVNVSATGDSATADFKPSITVQRPCASYGAGSLAQAFSFIAGEPTIATVPIAPLGRVFIWVDSPIATSFSLDLAVADTNDTCGHAQMLRSATEEAGDTTFAVNDYGANGGFSGACAAALGQGSAAAATTAGPDVVFGFLTPRDGDYTITIHPSSPAFDPVIWITARSECGMPQACLALADTAGPGDTEQLSFRGVAGRTYAIIVDSQSAAVAGGFGITVR